MSTEDNRVRSDATLATASPRPRRFRRSELLAALAIACVAASWSGCASGNGSTGEATPSASSQAASSSSSGAGGKGGAGGDSGVCTYTSTSQAKIVPLDLIVLLDRSGSMDGDKWQGSKLALTQFFMDPASAGISAGMLFLPNEMSYDSRCDFVSYENLVVPIAPLPGNAFALSNAMPDHALGVDTPMLAAMQGAAFAAAAYQDLNPTHKVNIILATDGYPYGCGFVTIDAVAAVAQGVLDYNGVRTYVLGMQGSSISGLNLVASSGGTGKAFDITNDISQFSQAMADIRESALGCEFSIPPPPKGMQLLPDDVNVTYQAGGMGLPVTLPRAKDLADCGNDPGWHYDNNKKPTKIVLCPASCSIVKNDAMAGVSVAFGCHSEIK